MALLAFHEKSIGCEHRAIPHGRAIVNECADPEGAAAGADHGAIRLEGAVLL